ncbi:MAG: nucleotidyl transferase AbiEii/AbiGii toxin family protein [Propionibacteriaceae bacterium]|jgi:predicted nucleotidyltransferase component of viral defense system|nr:nucleotidyl transferase AbiEii/AbiGii toxin family protein [Propionibacteriaceae bacterium]
MVEPVTQLDFAAFQPRVAEKVVKLLLILDRIGRHPLLKPRLCLHGGTALNLFVLGAPRLSVDIDLNYIGSTDRDVMIAERPAVEKSVIAVAGELGFALTVGAAQHAGRSFRLQYQGQHGHDQVKIDLDYLNRSPLLLPVTKAVSISAGAEVSFLLNSDIELFAGKTKALLERVAVRDLYDVGKIASLYPEIVATGDEVLLRRIMLYYLSISAPFPRPFQVSARFSGCGRDVATALYPMLAVNDRPSLSDMIAAAESFVEQIAKPQDDVETEYLERAARADFAPECLFVGYPETLAAARADPAAAWKMRNLAKS